MGIYLSMIYRIMQIVQHFERIKYEQCNKKILCSLYRAMFKQKYQNIHRMAWRQGTPGVRNLQNDSVGQITKLRLEITRLKIQLEDIKKQQQPKNGQISKMASKIEENKQRQNKIKSQLTKIGVIINCNQLHRINQVYQLLDAIEKKAIENRDLMNLMERELQKYHSQFNNINANNEKNEVSSREIQILQKKLEIKEQQNKQINIKNSVFLEEMKKLRVELEKKEFLLGELSHKISQLEIEKKDIEQEIKNIRSASKSTQSQVIKKQCEQLINQINVKDDDYLKSYLLKNHRFQNSTTNSVSRRNKHDFIFQD